MNTVPVPNPPDESSEHEGRLRQIEQRAVFIQAHADGHAKRDDPCTNAVELLTKANEDIRELIALVRVESLRAEAWRQKGVESALRSIEARNPGIDIEQVRREHFTSSTQGDPT